MTKAYNFLNKHQENIKKIFGDNFYVTEWLNHTRGELHKGKDLLICSRIIIHWAEGVIGETYEDGQIFKSFFNFRKDLIRRDLKHFAQHGFCGGYDKVKFSILGVLLKKDGKMKDFVFTSRVDLGDGKYGIEENIDVYMWLKSKNIEIVPTKYDLTAIIKDR